MSEHDKFCLRILGGILMGDLILLAFALGKYIAS